MIREDDTVDGDAFFRGEESFGDEDFEGPFADGGGDGADECEAGFFGEGERAEDEAVVFTGFFVSGGGGEVHVDEVAAVGKIGGFGHDEVPLDGKMKTALSRSRLGAVVLVEFFSEAVGDHFGMIFAVTLGKEIGESIAAAFARRADDELPVIFGEFDFASDFKAELDGEVLGYADGAGISPFLNDGGHGLSPVNTDTVYTVSTWGDKSNIFCYDFPLLEERMNETRSDMNESMEQSNTAVIAVEDVEGEAQVERKQETRTRNKPKRQPPYHVVIWNDEEHTYEYVIELLMKLFGHSFEAAYQITHEVDHAGKGIAHTCHQELAELKRDQVLAYGADWRMKISKGSIRATIEPAPE